MLVCYRCQGQKKVYHLNGGYSLINVGGKRIDCPLCNGVGKIPELERTSVLVQEQVREAVAADKQVKSKSKKITERSDV